MFGEGAGENVLDFFGENEVKIADAFHAVRDEVDDDLIPDVEPLGVMIHRFGDERNARHVAESGKKIFALVLAMEFAVLNLPFGQAGHQFCDFVVGEFARLHKGPPERWGYSLWYARGTGATIARPQRTESDRRCGRWANPLS